MIGTAGLLPPGLVNLRGTGVDEHGDAVQLIVAELRQATVSRGASVGRRNMILSEKGAGNG